MKKHLRLIPLLLISALLTACQPTPSTAVVVEKGGSKLDEKIVSTLTPEEKAENLAIAQNQTWTETYKFNKLTCQINAVIQVPSTDSYPVFQVEKSVFDIETSQRIVGYFTRKATAMREATPTKEELTEQLLRAQRGIYQEDGKYHQYEGQEADIARLKDEIQNAPDEQYCPVTTISELPAKSIYLLPQNERIFANTSKQTIQIGAYRGIPQAESWVLEGDAYEGELSGKKLSNVKISEADARKVAQKLLEDLNLQHLGIAWLEKGRLIEDSISHPVLTEGYYIRLARNDGNSIPSDLSNAETLGILQSAEDEYIERWRSESLTLLVDDTGVRYFSWKYPLIVTETLNENVSLKPLEEMKELIKNHIRVTYDPTLSSLTDDVTMNVNRIVLANQLCPIKDDNEHSMLIPVWLVYYTYDYNGISDSFLNTTYVFALNAVDGSTIAL